MAKFNHKPYEDWVLDPDGLQPEQARSLQEHLQTCEICQGVADALREVEHTLRSEEVLSPAPGFASRWQARLIAERRRSQRRQTFVAMCFSLGGGMMLLSLLLIGIVPLVTNPYAVLWSAFSQAAQSYALLTGMGEALATLTRIMFGIIPPTMWVAILVALGSLFALWIILLQRLAASRRVVR